MTVAHVNFYENIQEARMRLLNTVVMYGDVPVSVMAMQEHKDGVIRVYLKKLGVSVEGLKAYAYDEGGGLPTFLDEYIKKNPKSGVLRKKMNSPKFNRFRPFPLGMCNVTGKEYAKCYFLERQPQRNREQGLTRAMVDEKLVTIGEQPFNPRGGGMHNVELYSEAMAACITGDYPTAQETLDALKDPDVINEAVGFHRNFALIRGPVGTIFLAYKADVVGLLSNADFTRLRLSKEFKQVKEAVEDLKLFDEVII